jgi:bifunctional DNA-binding transcriptional regulator/antitoxin component of YhaV-PrlF toxin-antitoxin module
MPKPVTITVTDAAELVLPLRVRRLAGIKAGDRLQLSVSPRTITITAVEPTYKPSKAELAAIREGEAAIARGDSVSFAEFLNVDSHRRKARPKVSRRVPR